MKNPLMTHAEYMENSSELHRTYYAQFIDDTIKQEVLTYIGKDKILASKDEHFNDIPLRLWDRMAGFVFRGSEMIARPHTIRAELSKKLKETGEGLSSATMVCIYKEYARQIREKGV